MIVLLTISDSRWEHLLQAKEDELGRFYVYLADAKGERVKHSPVQGGFKTVEMITHNAHSLYRALIAMKDQARETRMRAGLVVAETLHCLRPGDPRYDDTHPKF